MGIAGEFSRADQGRETDSTTGSFAMGQPVTVVGRPSEEVFLVLERLNTLEGLVARLWRISPRRALLMS